MKKLKVGALVLICIAFITACSCAKSFTVVFDSNGGTSVSSQTVLKDGRASVPADPTKEGYTFGGWMKDGKTYDFNTPVTSNITLKAEWIANSTDKNTYTVTFNSNGGSSVNSITVTAGESKSLPTASRSGYTFLGWYDGNTKITNTSEITANTRLTAKWEENKTSSNTNTGTTTVAVNSVSVEKPVVTVVIGETSTINATVAPSNATDKTVTYTSGDETIATVSADGKITGVAEGNTTITVKAGNKTATVEVTIVPETLTVTFTSDSAIVDTVDVYKGHTLATLPSATKVGHTLDGWYNGSNKLTTSTVINENVTYDAVWNINTYTVTFNSNGGSAVASQTVNHGALASMAVTTKDNYIFNSWTSGDSSYDFSTPVTGDLTLTAKWDTYYYNNSFELIGIGQYKFYVCTNTLTKASGVTYALSDSGVVGTAPSTKDFVYVNGSDVNNIKYVYVNGVTYAAVANTSCVY